MNVPVVDRTDLGAALIAVGLAWHLDMPGILVGAGIGIALFGGLSERLGTRAGAAVARRLNRNRPDDVVKLP